MDRPDANIVFLDIEASGLGLDSFPIELGWAWLGGASSSLLIKPARAWSRAGWDDLAEAVHGISWAQLEQEGIAAWDVAGELERLFGRGAVLILSDATEMDGFWLDRLYEQSPLERRFQLTDFGTAFQEAFRAIEFDATALELNGPRQHRAAADALLLRDGWMRATSQSTDH